MKKLVALALALSLAFVLNNACAAQENGNPMTLTGIANNVEGIEFVSEVEVGVGPHDCCPDPCASACVPRCGLFSRRAACRPFMANPCNPCPPYVQTACTPCPRPVCPPPVACPTLCEQPCGFDYGCAPYGYGHGYGSCYGGYGYGYGYGCGYPYGYRTPIRNFLVRVFAPRPYIGYDAYYGPYGDCFGYGY